MKKTAKTVMALILSLIMFCSLTAAFAEGGQSVRNVNEAFALVRDTELIAIYDAELYRNGKCENVYYVVCKGLDFSEFNPDQPRSYANAIKIALSCEKNSYITALISAVSSNVPAGAKVVFLGHSMGGMVIQQAIASKELKDKYDIVCSTTLGSPYILTGGAKEGTLYRVIDSIDPVAYLSIPLLANPCIGNVSVETSFLVPLVHFRSYESGWCWRSYDCLGVKNGGAYVVLNDLVYYA